MTCLATKMGIEGQSVTSVVDHNHPKDPIVTQKVSSIALDRLGIQKMVVGVQVQIDKAHKTLLPNLPTAVIRILGPYTAHQWLKLNRRGLDSVHLGACARARLRSYFSSNCAWCCF